MHLMEELQSQTFKPKVIITNQSMPAAIDVTANIPPPPPPPLTPSKRSYDGTLTQLELLLEVKEALIRRIEEQERKEQFLNDIKELKKKIKKIRGMN